MAVLAGPKVLADRKAVCEGCINKETLLGIDQCRLCGCLLAVKMRLLSSECPLKKWEPA